jgi:dynein heavy chain
LLRQIADSSGFYDRTLLQWKELEQTQLIAASVHPGSGRPGLSSRFVRHFQIVNILKSGNDVMLQIFGTIFKGFLETYEFREAVKKIEEGLVLGTLNLYQWMMDTMVPTMYKPHYTFNLRDVSKVFQGILACRPEKFNNPTIMTSLWVHECERVFCDRLVNQSDRKAFYEQLMQNGVTHLGMRGEASELQESHYIFGDFMNETTRELEWLQDIEKVKR